MKTNTDQHESDNAAQWRGSGQVVVLSRDVFFGMRIRTSLRQLGYEVAIAQDIPSFTDHQSGGAMPATLGLIEFNNAVDWSAMGDVMATGVPMIAFGPHTDVEGFRAAKAAGAARVVANGEFSRSLPALAKRYALSEKPNAV